MTAPAATRPPWVVLLAASAGGIEAVGTILNQLPAALPAAVVVVQHRPPKPTDGLTRVLGRRSRLPLKLAAHGEALQAGVVYLARSDNHLTIGRDGRFAYVDGTRIAWLLSSANPLFESAAGVFRNRVLAIVLTGSGHDGTDGVQSVKAAGGIVIVQDQATAQRFEMPRSAIASGAVDRVLPLDRMAATIVEIVSHSPEPATQA